MKAVEKGLIIHRSSYSETSLLVTILTELHGISTFLFQGGKKKKGNLLAPMAHVEFSYYRRNDSSLAKISEVSLIEMHQSILFDPIKGGIAFFMAELIHRLVRPGHPEKKLYDTMAQEANWLDHSNELTNYPVWLLSALTQHLGITPSVEHENPTVFDIPAGKLTTVSPLNPHYIRGAWIHWMESAIGDEKTHFLSMEIPRTERLLLLDAWISYYKYHLHGIREIKSLEIMREVMTN